MSEPLANSPSAERIGQRLARRVWFRIGSAVLAIAVGVPCCFLGPLLVSFAIWFAVGRLGGIWHPWVWYFTAFSGVMIPLLFLLEHRTEGQYMSEALADADDRNLLLDAAFLGSVMALRAPSGPIFFGNVNARELPIGFVEVFLFGPRLMLPNLRRLVLCHRLRGTDLRAAVRVLQELLNQEKAVPIRNLIRPDRNEEQLLHLLAWLGFYDWIAPVDKHSAVFIPSLGRTKLQGLQTAEAIQP